MLSLAGGLPSPSVFPYRSVRAELRTGEWVTADDEDGALSAALQYPVTPNPLLAMVTEHMSRVHRPCPRKTAIQQRGEEQEEEWKCLLTVGTTDATDKVARLLLERGDSVFAEEWTYPTFLQAVRAIGVTTLAVPMDHEGMLPEALDQACIRAASSGTQRLPKVVYLVPHGQNPTGASSSLARKRALYQVAQRHGLLIIEDDAYFYIQFPSSSSSLTESSSSSSSSSPSVVAMADVGAEVTLEQMPGLNHGPSYFSIDEDGRVIRMDSLSKLVAPMMRVGWVTASPCFIDALHRHSSLSSMGPSAFSTRILALDLAGPRWEQRARAVQLEYFSRRSLFLAAMQRHLTGLASWNVPQAGMFVWVSFPGVDDTRALMKLGAQTGILILPGDIFSASGPRQKTPFARLTFAAIDPSLFDEAFLRLSQLLKTVIIPTALVH